uniref:Thioredoxin domain-containing protein n=1 Tax=Phaeomonas parva TaxID=124430 RepID=A0A7S1UE41_9STRA|mmetsp:Transcript_43452/g.136245  ORF Transcript_43452/g.136245 Transcript_43452/m.136245 type:complete len:256 (+) Transcript_43452:256-1023(+)
MPAMIRSALVLAAASQATGLQAGRRAPPLRRAPLSQPLFATGHELTGPELSGTSIYDAIKEVPVYAASDGGRTPHDLGSLWGRDEVVVLVFFRSFGCPFCQELALTLARDVIPTLGAAGVKLVAVGIGTGTRAVELCEHLSFPTANLFADPTNEAYGYLGFMKDAAKTFFDARTPLAIAERIRRDGAKDLLASFGRWKPWTPPRLDQGYQQGGCFVFQGENAIYGYKDPATGAHADLNKIVGIALASQRTLRVHA